MEEKKKYFRYGIYGICACMVVLLAYFVLRTPEMKVRIIYRLGQHTEATDYMILEEKTGSVVIPGVISRKQTAERRMFDTFFYIPKKELNPEHIQLQLQPRNEDEDSRIQIRAIEIWNRNISMMKYAPEDIEQLFQYTDAEEVYVEGERLCIEPVNDKQLVTLQAGQRIVEDFSKSTQVPKMLLPNLLFAGILLWILCIGIDITWRKRRKIVEQLSYKCYDETEKRFQVVMSVLMLLALGCVIVMAFWSKYYAHPDEDVTRLAIDYYMTHWLPPDRRDISVLGTFSNYGVTRLTEHTLYYFVAGKLGWIFLTIFQVQKYYRALNVLLFAVLVGILLWKKKNIWLLIGIGITPQIWYLFSYATSDSWDFFWSALIIFQLVYKDSLLWSFLNKRSNRPVLAILWNAFLFSMIFRGKQNYYLILLFTFIVLVLYWLKSGENKWQLLFKYILIAGCSVLLLIPRICTEKYIYAQFEKKEAVVAATEVSVDKEAVQAQRDEAYSRLRVDTRMDMGYSFIDVAIKDCKDIISGLTNTGVGCYGWIEYRSSYFYGYAITLLYAVITMIIIWMLIGTHGVLGILESAVILGMVVLAYLMVVYNCWTSDFQTQGRYVLLLTLIVGYFSMIDKKICKRRMIQVLIAFLGIMSISSFVFKGLWNMI